MTPLDEIPLVDNHVHPPLLDPGVHPFARYFSESGDAAMVKLHVPETLFYRRAINELAQLLDCAPDPNSVQAARSRLGQREYLQLLVRESNIETMLIDDGYPPSGAMDVASIAGLGGCATRRILRIETLAETLVPAAANAVDLADRLTAALEAERGLAALKTVIAYRCGLQVGPTSVAEADKAFKEVRAASGWNPPRLVSRPLLNFLLLHALEWASGRGVAVQFHTGYGDRDIDLPLANPALLRPLLEDPLFADLTVVLLHASYPFSREASYLASVYPNVFVDWSEVNPMLPPRQLQRVLEELLALAPVTKLLYGSDAWGIPDWIYLAARAGRAALWTALVDEPGREQIARRILRENAVELYRLGA